LRKHNNRIVEYSPENRAMSVLNYMLRGHPRTGLTINHTGPHLTAPDHLEHHTGPHRAIWGIFRIINDPYTSISTLLATPQFVPYYYGMLHLFTPYYFMASWQLGCVW